MSTEENESLPGSSSSYSLSVTDNDHESFSSNYESSSQKSSGDNDEFSCPSIIELVDHDNGMATTLPQTSEELYISNSIIARSIINCTTGS